MNRDPNNPHDPYTMNWEDQNRRYVEEQERQRLEYIDLMEGLKQQQEENQIRSESAQIRNYTPTFSNTSQYASKDIETGNPESIDPIVINRSIYVRVDDWFQSLPKSLYWVLAILCGFAAAASHAEAHGINSASLWIYFFIGSLAGLLTIPILNIGIRLILFLFHLIFVSIFVCFALYLVSFILTILL